jgi:hypothetical protein
MAFFLLFLSALSFATPKMYEMDFDLALKGKKISHGKTITEEGKTATISQDGKYQIEVTAKDNGEDMVDMKFVIKDSKGIVQSSPRVIILEGNKALMTQDDEQGNEIVSLSVAAKEYTKPIK